MGMGTGWAQGRDPLQLGPWGEAKQSPFLGAVWALYKAEGAENLESAPSAGMQVAWVQHHRLPPRQGWGQAQHALGTGIPPSQRTMSFILEGCQLETASLHLWGTEGPMCYREGPAWRLTPTSQPIIRA